MSSTEFAEAIDRIEKRERFKPTPPRIDQDTVVWCPIHHGFHRLIDLRVEDHETARGLLCTTTDFCLLIVNKN